MKKQILTAVILVSFMFGGFYLVNPDNYTFCSLRRVQAPVEISQRQDIGRVDVEIVVSKGTKEEYDPIYQETFTTTNREHRHISARFAFTEQQLLAIVGRYGQFGSIKKIEVIADGKDSGDRIVISLVYESGKRREIYSGPGWEGGWPKRTPEQALKEIDFMKVPQSVPGGSQLSYRPIREVPVLFNSSSDTRAADSWVDPARSERKYIADTIFTTEQLRQIESRVPQGDRVSEIRIDYSWRSGPYMPWQLSLNVTLVLASGKTVGIYQMSEEGRYESDVSLDVSSIRRNPLAFIREEVSF